VRRWNGWGDVAVEIPLAPAAAHLLERLVGLGQPGGDATLTDALATIPESRLPAHPLVETDPELRLRRARGQSLPDWIALRSGHLAGTVPDGVARPTDGEAVRDLLAYAAAAGATVVPYGGGTTVVGGVDRVPEDDRPTLTVSLERFAGLRAFDERSGLATFGAGTTGPGVEAALGARGWTLGHYPQSFEFSTVGGWVAARSSGQQSAGFGRIEALYAGGRLEAPAGSLVMAPHPASAAGPDLRQLVLGSEGRLGVLTEVIVRATPTPELEGAPAFILPDFDRGLAAAAALARARLPLSMVRLATPAETRTTLAMGGHPRLVRLLDAYLAARGLGGYGGCLLVVIISGRRRAVDTAAREVGVIVGEHGGHRPPGGLGRRWLAERFRTPYLRNTLWDAGYAVDTLETAVPWSSIPALAAGVAKALRTGLLDAGERVHAFSHLSHVYPSGSSLYTTFVFRRAADPDETLERWRQLKAAASEAILEAGGTISHQHGVGTDHRPYLAVEKGELGIAALADVARRFDPDRRMHPGVLLP
jgi:alkyldihydroxyacetonephosphate synthase